MTRQHEVTLQAVLAERLLKIPDYQRPYAWEEKQLADLWEDLDLLGSRGAHYAGTLVLRDLGSGPGEPFTSMDEYGSTLRHCEVVDGQQRLTTCLLLLDRVRRKLFYLSEAGANGAAQVAERIAKEFGTVRINGADVPRLELGTELNTYWVESVLGDEPFAGHELLPGQRRLADAARFFDGRVEQLVADASPSEAAARLKELQRRVTAGLRFLVYEVGTSAEVGVIFETLNERGRPLTDLEKTKNYLLYLARQVGDDRSEQLADLINEKWSAIFKNLSGPAFGMDDQLLRAHWLATQNPDVRSWQRMQSIKSRFDRSKYVPGEIRLKPLTTLADGEAARALLFDEVSDYVQSLHRCSYFLAESLNDQANYLPLGEFAQRVRDRSAALRRSGVVALYRPLLFASRLAHPHDGEFYAELLDLCERYSARVFVIAQRRANAGQARLFRLAFDLYNGADRSRTLAEMRAVLWRYAPDERIREVLSSLKENWYVRRGHKYFLYEYELHLISPGEEVMPLAYFTDKAREQRTTEHILPQKPDEDASCWWNHFSVEQHVALRHSLGNLVLTLDNSSYSNKCFDKKRGKPLAVGGDQVACYSQGKLHQERELASVGSWTPKEIERRQERLAAWALERWNVAAPDAESVAEDEAEPEIEPEAEDDEISGVA